MAVLLNDDSPSSAMSSAYDFHCFAPYRGGSLVFNFRFLSMLGTRDRCLVGLGVFAEWPRRWCAPLFNSALTLIGDSFGGNVVIRKRATVAYIMAAPV